MKESIPSSAQPPHAAMNPRIWFGVSGVRRAVARLVMNLREYTDMRALFAPHGTRGDIQPMLALAVVLRARGHRVRFAVPASFVDWVAAHGFDVVSNGVDIEADMRSAEARLESLRWMFNEL